MRAEEFFGQGENLFEEFQEEFQFPVKVVFHDVETETVKEMDVTREAFEDAKQTFEGDDNVSENVMYKYMSKHETVETQPFFKE